MKTTANAAGSAVLVFAAIAGSCGGMEDVPAVNCWHWFLYVDYPDNTRELYSEGYLYNGMKKVEDELNATVVKALDELLKGTEASSELVLENDNHMNLDKCAYANELLSADDGLPHCWEYIIYSWHPTTDIKNSKLEGYFWGVKSDLLKGIEELENWAKMASDDKDMTVSHSYSKVTYVNDEKSCKALNKNQ